LRKHGFSNAYELMKNLSRNNKQITYEDLFHFVENLEVSKEIKEELHNIKPENYVGSSFE